MPPHFRVSGIPSPGALSGHPKRPLQSPSPTPSRPTPPARRDLALGLAVPELKSPKSLPVPAPFRTRSLAKAAARGPTGRPPGAQTDGRWGTRDGPVCRALCGTGCKCPPAAPVSFSGLGRSLRQLSKAAILGRGETTKFPAKGTAGESDLFNRSCTPPPDPSTANGASRLPSCQRALTSICIKASGPPPPPLAFSFIQVLSKGLWGVTFRGWEQESPNPRISGAR